MTISQTGLLGSSEGQGIYAASGNGNVEVNKTGTSGGGSAKVVQTGAITSYTGKGVVVRSDASSATLEDSGAITAKSDSGNVTVAQTGTVTSNAGKGIDTYTP